MIAVDTNVLVRFLVRDDERQAQRVYARFKHAESTRGTLFVPLLVVLETIWVLESAYDKPPAQILDALEALLGMPILAFEDEATIRALVAEGRRERLDLSALLIAKSAEAAGCAGMMTFDRRAMRDPFFQAVG